MRWAWTAYLKKDRIALSIGGTKAFADVNLARFERLARKAGLPGCGA